jgi:hypothetical protein
MASKFKEHFDYTQFDDLYDDRRPSLTNTLDTLSTASLSSIHKKPTIVGWCLRQKAKMNRFRHLL